jgi:hypothetical protein
MGLFDFWRPKYTATSNQSFEDAIHTAVHQNGPKIGHQARLKVVRLEADIHEGWHITTYVATIQKTGGGG